MNFIKLTNQVTKQPIWINPFWIVHVDEIASGSRIVMAGGNTGITRIVCESPEEIFKKINEGFEVKAFVDEEGNVTPMQLTPY